MSFEQAVVNLEQTNAKLQEEVVRFRDASMGLNAIYSTIAEGRQAVADGKYFSVPGGGAYMRLYRRQGSSANLIAEFPDRAKLVDLISQLEPLLGRGVEGGSGNILAENAFGLGGSGFSITDWNNTPNVNCFLVAGSSSSANKPPGGATSGIQVATESGNYKKQYACGINYTTLYSRVFDNGVWSDWDNFIYGSTLANFGVAGVTKTLPSTSNYRLSALDTGLYNLSSNVRPADYTPEMGEITWGSMIGLRRTPGGTGGVFFQELSSNVTSVRFVEGDVSHVNRLWGTRNTTVDSNGFLKAASPIYRLSNTGETAESPLHGFRCAGSGASNGEAKGVTATHDAIGVYTITGSQGFVRTGWAVEVPQDANGNRLCVVETEQADDGTITVHTFSKRIDPETGDIVANQPMDIPEGRWIDLRLSMPETPTNDHPDDTPAPSVPLTPEEQEQQRIEQLERWRASAAITPRQARLVLAKHGLLADVADAIAAIADEKQRQVAEIEWEYATTIERAASWVNVLYGSLGLSQEGVDELFREAGLI